MQQVLVEVGQRGVLDRGARRAAGPPSRRPRRRRAPACRGSSRWRGPGCCAAGCRRAPSRAASGNGGIPTNVAVIASALGRGQHLGEVHDAYAGPLARQQRRRCASGRSCRRRPAPRRRSRARGAPCPTPSRPRCRLFLTAKVPPKPQHSSARGRSTRVSPRTARSSRVGPVADAEHPQRVARRVVGHPVRERRARRRSPPARRRGTPTARRCAAPVRSTASTSAASPDRRATMPCWWRAQPAHEPDGVTTASYPSKARRRCRTAGTASSR